MARWIIIAICLVIYGRLFFVVHNARRTTGRLPDSHVLDSTAGSPSALYTSTPEPRYSRVNITPAEKGWLDDADLRLSGLTWKYIAYQMMSYPLVYILIWTIPTTIRIYQTVTNKPAPAAVLTIFKVSVPYHLVIVPFLTDTQGLHDHPGIVRCYCIRIQRKFNESLTLSPRPWTRAKRRHT
jgi:hypothetical protein